MARPGAIKQFEQELDEATKRANKHSQKVDELKKAHGDVGAAEKRLEGLSEVITRLEPEVKILESKKEALTAWVKDFRDNKTIELEREFSKLRNVLVSDITKLEGQRAEEEMAISQLTEAQAANDRQRIRQMEQALSQNKALGEKRTIIHAELERANREHRGNAVTRSTLNARLAKLEERERRFDIKGREYDEAMGKAETAIKQANARKAALESTALDLQEQQTEVQAARNALKAEQFAARNEMTRLKAALGPLNAELAALRENIGALERRERLVADKERRLQLKGVDLGS